MQIRSRIIQRIIVHEIKEKFNCRAPPSKFSLLSFRASRSPCPLTKGSPFHTFNSQGVSLLRVTLKLYHDNSLSLSLFSFLSVSLCVSCTMSVFVSPPLFLSCDEISLRTFIHRPFQRVDKGRRNRP